jgi:hypothetical protein
MLLGPVVDYGEPLVSNDDAFDLVMGFAESPTDSLPRRFQHRSWDAQLHTESIVPLLIS